jgi:hypothetical protein
LSIIARELGLVLLWLCELQSVITCLRMIKSCKTRNSPPNAECRCRTQLPWVYIEVPRRRRTFLRDNYELKWTLRNIQ